METRMTGSGRIEILDGLKGLAILAVIYTHTFGAFTEPSHLFSFKIGRYAFSPFTFLSNTNSAVTFFFILSGFLLMLPYVRGQRQMQSRSDVFDFYRKRAVRLLPAYYFTLAIILAAAAPDSHPREALWHAATFGTFLFQFTDWLPTLSVSQGASYAPLWYMGVLFLACVLFPLLLWLMNKLGRNSVLLCVLLIAFLLRFLILVKSPLHVGNVNSAIMNFYCRIDDFTLGMVLSFIHVENPRCDRLSVLSIGGLFLVLLGFLLTDNVNLFLIPNTALSIVYTLIGVGSTMLIHALLSSKGILQKFFELWILRLLGRMSYSLYLLHGIAIFSIKPSLNIFRSIEYVALVMILSGFCYRYIENGSVKDWRELLPKKLRSERQV